MKIRHAVLLVSLVLLFAGVSLAQVLDPPRIIFGGSETQPFNFNACTPIAEDTEPCTATLDNFGNASLGITNNTGMDLNNVTITVQFPLDNTEGSMPCAISTVEYATLYGFNSAIKTAPNACTFAEIPDLGSIGTGKIFDLDLVGFCTGEPTACTATRGTVKFSLTTAPEPGTILLLGTGLAAVMVWRKRVKGITQDA